MNPTRSPRSRIGLRAVAIAGIVVLGACSGGSTKTTAPVVTPPTPGVSVTSNAGAAAPSTGGVLPVSSNPISNAATVDGLRIDSVLVENNVDAPTGKGAKDHLEIALKNTTTTDLSSFEIYYTYADPKTGVTENYYMKLPTTFTIAAGKTRIAHFDNTGAPDHFPVNKFSLYHTDINTFDATVTVSAQGVKVQSATVKKDAGGAETAD